MNDLGKINSSQLYLLWRNLTVSILSVIATLVFSRILPYYLSPVVALAVSAFLYFYIYNTRLNHSGSCIMPCLTILYCIVGYAFVSIILNLLHIWGLWDLPHEFVFFTDPFIPSLLLNPISFIVILYLNLRHDKLKVCVECRMRRNMGGQRGAQGVLNREAHLQLKNFVYLSGILTLLVWGYYAFFYIDVNINDRDTYVFIWLTIITLLLDEIYFSYRYFNLYLDMKEGKEIISASELQQMNSKTYIRFYVFCGENIYINVHSQDPNIPGREVIDTPFFTSVSNGELAVGDIKNIIAKMTGVNNGSLKFFYGRLSPNDTKHRLLRYFYFIDEEDCVCRNLETDGEWMSFSKMKYIYSTSPSKLAELAVFDLSRLATIILTEKIFDKDGYRKSKIKSYTPSFTVEDVKKSDIDFQDDKWIEISLFNSDTSMFRFKKWWRSKFNKVSNRWN